MFKTLHKTSLRTRLVLLTAVSVLALVIALVSAYRTARTSEAFARRQAESNVSNAARELAREARDYPNGRSDSTAAATSGAKKRPPMMPPHEREILARYNDSFSRSSAIALHRFADTAGGFCAGSGGGEILGLTAAENFGAMPNEQEREAIKNFCRQMNRTQDFSSGQIAVGDNVFFYAVAPALFENDVGNETNGAIFGAFAFRRLPASPGVFGDWFNLLTQGFLLASVIGLTAFSFLTWRDWQSGMRQIETGLREISNDLRARIIAPPMPELNRVGNSINNLAADLDANLQRRKELEQTLVRNEKLAALGRVVAGVAHEVRNPLASMKLKIQLATRGDFEKRKIEKTFDVLQQEIERLDNLVKKLLDVSRPARLNFSGFSLIELIRQRLSLVAEQAAAQNVKIEFNAPGEAAKIIADRERLAQVFDNLFRNALEAMPSGGTLEISLEKESDFYRVKIADTGAGFSAEERERLFEPFFTTRDKGTGLGLTISRELTEAHGGKIRLIDDEAKGAAFVVELLFDAELKMEKL